MDHKGAIDHILDRLTTELSSHLLYHGHHHTLDVLEAAERIANHEKISAHEMKLLLVAAAYHDCGFLTSYVDHELAGCAIVQRTLPEYGFDQDDIDAICTMIMATKVPQDPRSRLANILCDADLDYLGRDDFYPIGNTLFEELKYMGIVKEEQVWNRIQVKFLTAHIYHTTYSKDNREQVKLAHLAEVERIVESYPVQ
jgi:uncharacterized protein